MKYPYFLLFFILFFSGCSSLPTQAPSQDSQIESKTESFTWVGVQVGMRKNKSSLLDGEEVVVALNIYPLSPAMKANVKKNDIIVSINGEKLKDHSDFVKRIRNLTPNQEVRLKVFRGGNRIDLKPVVKTYDMESYVREVTEYVKKVGSDDFAHLILGDYYARGKIFQKAIEHYEIASKINPKSSTAYAALADIYGFELKKYEEGIEYFKKAISISPEHSDYHFDLGLMYAIVRKHDAAVSEFINVININPKDFKAHQFLGDEYVTLKKYQEAMGAFKKSIQIYSKQYDLAQ